MGAPKGSKNALGNKGGGRKSAYEERANADAFWNIFEKEHDIQKIEAKLRSRKFSGWDVLAAKILAGNEKLLVGAMRKLIPDRMDVNDLRQAKSVEELESNVRALLESGNKPAKKRVAKKKPTVVKLKK